MTNTTDDPIADAEIIEGPTTAAVTTDLVHVAQNTLVVPAAPLDQIASAFAAYQQIRSHIVTPSDLQPIGRDGKTFVKKSGWRKMAVAFGVSDRITREDERFDEAGQITRCKTVVEAIAPNGRVAEGIGLCHVLERCCPARTGGKCYDATKSWHVCCSPETCDGRKHFSKPEHDIPATAHTRAKNRAFSDLFGFGEVSAEELSGLGAAPDSPVGDLVDKERAIALRDRIASADDDTFKQWCKQNYTWPWTAHVCDEIEEAFAARPMPESPALHIVAVEPLPVEDRTKKRIFAMCNERNIDEDERHRLISEATAGRSTSANDLTQEEAESLVEYLKGIPKP
jgi:hypothetical protein